MYLYNLTLQKATGVYQAISGSFSAPKMQEIVQSRGNILDLIGVDSNGKVTTLISKEVFGQIRKILPFRLTGNNRDYILVGSDSGRIVVLEANVEKRDFLKIHQETFGKTGCRRIVPGDYLAADPKGRAIMIGAIEKQKFVYIINRDSENKMTISSPLEAHKSHTLCFDICGIDNGYENPIFACLEVDYGDPDNENSSVNTGVYQKLLVYYEMDLGLNHVVRKHFEIVDNSAHLLAPLPKDGPGGVIIFCENFLIYNRYPGDTNTGVLITPYPLRKENSNSKVMITCYTSFKKKDLFFLFAQSELGDIYKITIQYTSDSVHGITMQYFETIPPANSMCLLSSGFLFSASETSNQYLYVINSFDIDNDVVSHSTMRMEEALKFIPKELTNLQLVDEVLSPCLIADMVVEDLIDEGTPQIYTVSGRGSRSTLRVMKPGMSVTDIGASPIPGKPLAIWTVKGSINDKYDKYIVLGFQNSTLVLGIGDKIAEVTNSGFDLKKPSLHVGLMEDNTFIQVFPGGIIHIKQTGKKSLYQTSSRILSATSNSKQIILALQDKEIMYFELDEDKLSQIEKKVMDREILCVDIPEIPEGRTRSKFFAVGCADNSVRIMSLDIEQCLSRISLQMLPSSPESVLLSIDNHLYVGLSNGVLVKTTVDSVTGMQSDTRNKYLGTRAVSLFRVRIQNMQAVLANSSKAYISYNFMGKNLITNLSYETIDSVSNFSSEQCNEGMVIISDNSLKILSVERLGESFSQRLIPLRYTPRKILTERVNNNLVIIESDQYVYSKREKDLIKQEIAKEDPNYIELSEDQIGVPQSNKGRWGSCIRMIEPYELNLVDLIEFEENEAVFSACIMSFASTPGELFLIVGAAKDLSLVPRSFSSASIIVFVFREQGKKIEFLFRNPVEDIPMAFCEYQGRLLAGVGSILRIYDIGKAHLLKKCETKKINSVITSICTFGPRILVGTMNESFHLLRHSVTDNQLYLFADDSIIRWLTCGIFLDYDTIAGCDKFENFFVYRIPKGSDEENLEDPMGSKHRWEVGYLHGAAYKLDLTAQFHRGDLITSIKKCSLVGGEDNVIAYSTASGAIGVFMPLETREEVDFFLHLEMYLRIETSSLVGRDHQMYRSAYGPVKSVIDGDLCEEFTSLEMSKQKQLATEIDKTPSEIERKLEEVRNKIL